MKGIELELSCGGNTGAGIPSANQLMIVISDADLPTPRQTCIGRTMHRPMEG
jgi:hypothetical protein